MKLIQSSIEAEILQNSISHGDLAKEMASCDIAPVNGQQAKESIKLEKTGAEKVAKTNKLTNGVNGKIASPSKCNGDMGYYDDISDDDYQLVLEASSDEGGSPAKKIDDDTISAPQIVQEIEDLLGIDSSSVGIDDELEKDLVNHDGSESIDLNEKDEDNLINGEITNNIPQEIQDVFEEQEVTSNGIQKEASQKEDKKEEDTVGVSKPTETTECDSSSNMDLVFDEVEIGTDNMEIQDTALIGAKNVEKPVEESREATEVSLTTTNRVSADEDDDCKVESTTEKSILNESVNTNKTEKDNDKSEKVQEKKLTPVEEIKINETDSEITLSQTSHLSDSSAEWTVLDSVGTSEDELKLEKETQRNSTEILQSVKELLKLEEGTTEDMADTKSQPTEDVVADIKSQPTEDVVADTKSQPTEDVVADTKTQSTEDLEVDIKSQSTEDLVPNTESQSMEDLEIDIKSQSTEDLVPNTESQSMEDLEIDIKSPLTEDMIVDTISSSEESFTEAENKLLLPDVKERSQDIDAGLDHQREDAISSSSASSTSEGGTPRKRTASLSELTTEHKRPKIVKDEKSAIENTTQSYKRPCSDSHESDTKRSKLDVSATSEEIGVNDKPSVEAASKPCEKRSEENTKTEESVKMIDTESSIDLNSEKIVKIGSDEDKVIISDKKVEPIEGESLRGAVVSNKTSKSDMGPAKSSVSSSEAKASVKNKIPSVEKAQRNETAPTPSSESSNNRPGLAQEKPSESPLASEKKEKVIHVIDVESKDQEESSMEIEEIPNSEDNEEVSRGSGDNSKDAIFQEDSLHKNISKEGKEKSTSKEAVKKIQDEDSYPSVKEIIKSVQLFNAVTPIQTESEKSTTEINKPPIKEVEKPTPMTDQVYDIPKKKSPFEFLSKNMSKKPDSKVVTNLDVSIDNVAKNTRTLPLLKKFHRDQLRKLSRSELEETVILKICEAVTDRSEIGQMRLRCQNLEQSNDVWRKKAVQFEKQNRELEMVLKRFLAETNQIKRDTQNNRMALPIKVTRSVGLQVVLASSMHGALVTSRHRMNSEPLQAEPSRVVPPKVQPVKPKPVESQPTKPKPVENQPTKSKPVENQPIKPRPAENQANKERAKATFVPPVQPSTSAPAQPSVAPRGRGRPPKYNNAGVPLTPSPQPSPAKANKATPPSTPAKASAAPKTIQTPTKDLEVIDLTEKEEKTKSTPMQTPPVGGSIRVSPSTQVCFVQQSSATAASPQMAYIVQKQGQRQQYLVTTASPSPSVGVVFNSTPGLQPRPSGNASRPPPPLTLPVLQSNRQILPYPSTPQVAVRSTTHPPPPSQRQVPQAIRIQSPVAVLKHPAPLPVAPTPPMKPGVKLPPPKPQLKIAKTVNGIMLSWSMTLNDDIADMASYQLYAYQEGNQAPTMNLWKKVGDVKALPLPMACTLTQFVDGHKYHFAVRAVDVLGRIGPFSPPSTITLNK